MALGAAAALGGAVQAQGTAGGPPTFPVYGPQLFLRVAGAPAAELGSFEVPTRDTAYFLRLHNGGADAAFRRVSSATIELNGMQLIGTDSFNQTVDWIEVPIEPELSNTLRVLLRSAPGSALAIEAVGVDGDPPTIVASVSPPPGPAGWHLGDVTVSFHCDDAISGIATCPGPVLVQSEGADQEVFGTATDRAGNRASTRVTVHIDRTPPEIQVTAPDEGSSTEGDEADVTGTAADSLSGIARVTCNGIPATLSGDAFSCAAVPLALGDNLIQVEASDVAGNLAILTRTVTRRAPSAPAPILAATMTPDALFRGIATTVTFRATIPYSPGAPPTVALERIDEDGSYLATLGALSDDGDAGDLLAQDGKFALQLELTPEETGVIFLRYRVEGLVEPFVSAPQRLPVFEAMTEAEFDRALALQARARADFEAMLPTLGRDGAVDAVLEILESSPGVMAAARIPDEPLLTVLYEPGVYGVLSFLEPGTRGGSDGGAVAAARELLASSPADPLERIESRQALLLSCNCFGGDETARVAELLEASECPSYDVVSKLGIGVDDFKALDRYGVIVIVTHGVVIHHGFPTAGGPPHILPFEDKVLLQTTEVATYESIAVTPRLGPRAVDFYVGRLALLEDKFAVTPDFITHYSGELPGSLVWAGACYSDSNPTMSDAFLSKGAGTYLGFTKAVDTHWAEARAVEFFDSYLGTLEARTTGDAFIPDQYDWHSCTWVAPPRPGAAYGCAPPREGDDVCEWPDRSRCCCLQHSSGLGPVYLRLSGSSDLHRPDPGLLNGGFQAESADGVGPIEPSFSGWTKKFPDYRIDAAVGWGPYAPTEPPYAARLFTFRPVTQSFVSQEFCLPPGADTLELDYVLLSEAEQYRERRNLEVDRFQIDLMDKTVPPTRSTNLVDFDTKKDWDALTEVPGLSLSLAKPVRSTGWIHLSAGIGHMAADTEYRPVELQLNVQDGWWKGNPYTGWWVFSQYPNAEGVTGVLIDGIKITPCCAP